VKVDTGLGRNGLTPADLPAVVDEALRLEAEGVVRLVGIWSHLAFADEPGHPSLHAQGDVLRAAAADAEARGARFEVRHIAASASTLTDPELHLDLVRPGIALYGLTPVPQLGGPERFGLVPAMTVEAELANVKRLPAGHGVSYGHHYVTPRDTVVGVVPLGYADGVPRHASGADGAPGAPLGVGGRRLAIAGRVCMDQVMVDLGPGATEQAGDRVVLFGSGADGGPTAQDWADAAGTISYEIGTDPAGVVHGTVDDAARAALVLALDAAHRGDADRLAAHLADLYREGDTAERRGVLRGLDALAVAAGGDLPGPVVAVGRDLAADALRANDTSLVAAAVGPFAAAHLDQHTWRHAVVKLVFQGTSLDAVAALDDRADAELARMARDLAAERRAAGRAVPDDLSRLTTPAPAAAAGATRTADTEEP
jgi:hypothetical protein